MAAELEAISRTVWRRIEEKGSLSGRTVTLKVKYADFRIVTRARSLTGPVRSREEFLSIGIGLLQGLVPVAKPVRLLGLTLSNLCAAEAPHEPVALPLPL